MNEFNDWLAAKGFDPEGLTATQIAPLESAWRAEQEPHHTLPQGVANANKPKADDQPAASGGETFDAKMKAIEAENERRDRILAMATRYAEANVGNRAKCEQIRKLADAAVADQTCTANRFELDMLRFDRTADVRVYSPTKPQVTNDVLAAAVCLTGKLATVEKEFNTRTLEAADKQFKGIGLHELIGACAEANGWRGGSVRRNLAGAIRAGWRTPDTGGEMGAFVGPSTVSLPTVLGTVVNKYVRESFNYVEQVWRQITAIRSVPDFKTITSFRLTGDLTYSRVAPGGEIQHGTLGETTFSNQLKTYGKMLGLDRTALINDDTGALAAVSRRLGRGGALAINQVFWTEFLNNSSFFTVGNGNADSGSDTLMDATGLANAFTLFGAITDDDGQVTGTEPAILLTPLGNYPAAWRLIDPSAPVAGDTTATVSPYRGAVRVLQSKYLSNSSYTGYSATAWYLLADPNDVPVIETVFLNGQEMPTVESMDFDFDRLGIAFRGFHDFGVTKQDYRGGVRMAGA